MIDSKLRPYLQRGFDRLAFLMVKANISPDQITVLAFFFGVTAAVLTGFELRVFALLLLWLSGLLDVLDGTVARLAGRATKGGAILDLILDRMVETGMVLGFYFWMPEHALMYLIFLIGMIFNFSTFMAAGSLYKNAGEKSMHYDPGILERTETFIFFTLILLFPLGAFPLFLLFNSLLFLTGGIRFIRLYKIQGNNHNTL